ncbi:hypothetical protein [Actinoplanes aureus]|uniref:Uncharacterized protein n=1 Tax=Actinoplanes aureus TaxID=2792083 RepID=A0A931CJG7_9ACTN|nr:hypothetical protein [Actinoplanes aureus]MBG0567536.1 hypothetical protein [Actinoplanes aureus]
MTDEYPHEVPDEAIEAAVRAIEAAYGRGPGDELDFEIMLLSQFSLVGRAEITRAFLLLIGVAFKALGFPHEDPALRHRVIGAALGQLEQHSEGVQANMLPTVAAAHTAAALDQDVCQWRESLGPITESEVTTWAFACFAIVGFVDDLQGAGTFGDIMSTILKDDD